MRIILVILFSWCLTCVGQVIPPSVLGNWVLNSTVGVVGGIPWRTNVIEANQAPYNADPTGGTPCGYPSGAIQNAINAATNGQVVHLTNGVYDITTGLTINRNGISLRGDGTNTILVGYMTVGNSPNFVAYPTNYAGFTIVSGSTLGSSNISISTNMDYFGTAIGVGDCLIVSSFVQSSDLTNWQVMTSRGNQLGASLATLRNAPIKQWITVTSVANGTNLGIWPPLVWNFTNAPDAYPFNDIGVLSDQIRTNVGLENFTLIGTNGSLAAGTFDQIAFTGIYNGWITNVSSIAGLNHDLHVTTCMNVEVNGCLFNGSRLSPGSNEGAVLVDNDTGLIIENSIIEGGAPGLEWNDGVSGCVFFANLFTNNFAGNSDMTMHKTHPVMDLIEGNVMSDFILDGYFGSSSHITYFRNRNLGTAALKRWNTYINVVGNVMGSTNFPFVYRGFNSGFQFATFSIGFPRIGDNTWSDTSPPQPWNYPGNFTADHGESITNGWFVTTNLQMLTNVIFGDYHMVPTNPSTLGNSDILGQDPVNTNVYYPLGPPTNATPSNMTFSVNVTVSNNWRMYIDNALAYQWRADTNAMSIILTGNSVCTNQSSYVTVWDSNGVQVLTNSYVYLAKPGWWGTNNWPAIGPDANPISGLIPAQERFLGIPTGAGQSLPAGLPASILF